MPKIEEELKQIYYLMVEKLRALSKANAFDKTMEENRSFSYIDQPDSYFCEKMVQAVFESGLRAWAWKPHKDEIAKEFCDFDVKRVAKFTDKDVERIMANPNIIHWEPKTNACIFNARRVVEISDKYNGFWKWIDDEVEKENESFPKPELIEKVQKTFMWLTGINAYYFLKLCGADVIKPDLNVRRIMFRLGLTDSDKSNKKVWKQVQEAGVKIAKASGVRLVDVDYVFYLYGSGGVQFFEYPICSKKPRCDECSLTDFCEWYGTHI